MKMLLTIGLAVTMALAGVGMLVPTAEALDPTPEIRAQCVGVWQEYPDGSRYWILYTTCVG